MRKSGPDVPPGYDPALTVDAKPKTKAAKRNERRKEKRHQVGRKKMLVVECHSCQGTGGVDGNVLLMCSISCIYLVIQQITD
jgi:hypothetical protein